MEPTPRQLSSPLTEAAQSPPNTFQAADNYRQLYEAQIDDSQAPKAASSATPAHNDPEAAVEEAESKEEPDKEYVSKIGILTTSLPMYHNQVMEKRREEKERANLLKKEQGGEPLEPKEINMLSNLSLEVGSKEQTPFEQAQTVKHLKPHSRSTIHLQTITANAAQDPDPSQTVTGKPKGKSTKWQFGIRSRNEPVDAIKCLYKALSSMGDCQWHVAPPQNTSKSSKTHDDGPFPVNVTGATHLTSGETTLSESPEKDKHPSPLRYEGRHDERTSGPAGFGTDGAAGSHHREPASPATLPHDSDSENDDSVDPSTFPPHYLPKDPWCIHVRWEKKGMSPAGTMSSSSARSSRIDLNSDDGSSRRKSVTMNSLSSGGGSAAGSATNVAGSGALFNFDDTACFVYMDLQIYVIEPDTYLVDFKCAGYESIVGEQQVKNQKGELITVYTGSGFKVADKDVTSPQPFLDLANKLVIHLAKGN